MRSGDRPPVEIERRPPRSVPLLDEPSTTILIDSGYTPAPASVADTRTASPASTLRRPEPEDGWLHVVDPVAERERPAPARAALSKTTAYSPGSGESTPAASTGSWKASMYGFRLTGRPA